MIQALDVIAGGAYGEVVKMSYLNIDPGLANGTLNVSCHNFLVTSSARLNFDPSVLSLTESSCFRINPRIALVSALYNSG